MSILSWFNQNPTIRTLLSPFILASVLAIGALYATSQAQVGDPLSVPDVPTTISGRVTNQQRQALADINVTVYRMYSGNWNPIRVVSTTVGGNYKALGIGAGTYRVSFVDPKEQYATVFYRGGPTIDFADDVVVTGFPITGIDGVLPKSAHITGSVKIVDEDNATTGEVWLFYQSNGYWSKLRSTTIQPSGVYEIAGLMEGIYRIRASYEELIGFYGGSSLENASNITITTGQTISNVTITVGLSQYNGVISGTVTADSKPLSGIRIDIDSVEDLFHPFTPTHIYTLTNELGQYGVSGLSDGYYTIRVSDPIGLYATTYYTTELYPNTLAYLQIRDGAILSNTLIANLTE